MLTPDRFAHKFAMALPYPQYLTTAKPHERDHWTSMRQRVALAPQQTQLVRSFSRRINILVLSGTWCGDCAHQCPMLDAIAAANPASPTGGIDLRFLDRDIHSDLADAVRICGGRRVPTAIFLNEDHEFTALMGDKSLARLRAIAARSLGASCPLPGAPIPDDEITATLADWLSEVERVHLILRLSPKLRDRHQD